MKKLFSFILFFTLIIVLSFSSSKKVFAHGDLDLIHDYHVKVDPLKDGTLDINISISWEVLDSSSEGPLKWVKIGIPNCFVYNLKALSNNISIIKYYVDNGSFIRIDFSKSYYAGEIVDFSFSFNQRRMYHLSGDYVYYDYNPGYFDSIKVENASLKWNATGAIDCNINDIVDGYYVYSSSLDYSDSIKINIKYPKSEFDSLSSKYQYSSRTLSNKSILLIALIVIGVITLLVIITSSSMASVDPYLYNRGFYGRTKYSYFSRGFHLRYNNSGVDNKGVRFVNPSSMSGGSSHGGSCACACACACAGGGRAGCSVKDFYHLNLSSKTIVKHLSNNTKERNKENEKCI